MTKFLLIYMLNCRDGSTLQEQKIKDYFLKNFVIFWRNYSELWKNEGIFLYIVMKYLIIYCFKKLWRHILTFIIKYARHLHIQYIRENWNPFRTVSITKSPRLGQCPSSTFFRQNNISMSSVVGSQYGAMTEAVESLIAQLTHRPSSLRWEAKIEKFDTKTKF
jgi:hypothetical protein